MLFGTGHGIWSGHFARRTLARTVAHGAPTHTLQFKNRESKLYLFSSSLFAKGFARFMATLFHCWFLMVVNVEVDPVWAVIPVLGTVTFKCYSRVIRALLCNVPTSTNNHK